MSENPLFEIVTLRSGLKSLRSLERNETFHPGIGPLEEARILHVEQQKLLERSRNFSPFILWDVGLGAAANAIAAIEALRLAGGRAEVHSFDLSIDPLEFALNNSDSLTYVAPYREVLAKLVAEGEAEISPQLKWIFHRGDFRELVNKAGIPKPHSIFYDPYSPATNREMWTLNQFLRLNSRASDDCLLTSYSRSTAVRVTLLLAGFYVGAGCVIGEKAETTIAATRLSSLDRPLTRDWLKRVQISRNGAPMKTDVYEITPIDASDYEALLQHPQFALSK